MPLAVAAGAVRAGTPFLFVSLGELLTEKSGRINLGLEGTLVMGAMSGYGTAYLTGSPWLGVLVAGVTGSIFGALHAGLCSLPKVNDIAVGIALMLFGTGLASISASRWCSRRRRRCRRSTLAGGATSRRCARR